VSRREAITIGVDKQILWIGGDAYPLHNIARARTAELVPSRGKAVASFAKAVLLWGVLAAGGAAALRFAKAPDVNRLTEYVAIGAAVLIGFSALKMLRVLLMRTMYALVIETSGTPHAALVNRNKPELDQIVHNIMAVINDPAAKFPPTIVNHNHNYGGTQFNLNGDRSSIGKVYQ
jgi:hypothetical protein